MRTGRPGDEACVHASVALAARRGVPVVATNDVRFLSASDFDAHEARVCIREGRTLSDPRRPKRYSPEQSLKTGDEMAALFSDIPEALDNALGIARRCSFTLELGRTCLPNFPVPEGQTTGGYLHDSARVGLEARLAAETPTAPRSVYDERLRHELDVIDGMGFAGYFLIVADFIRWARDNGVPVGPGRGSGAGSLVAWVLGITDLDPIRYDLLFERFLNPERVSMPDFDIDFCMDGRDRVIDYVAERYGREQVSQIITYGTMAARAVVRDVGRVLGHPYGFVDRIAKLVPFELGMTLAVAIEDEDLKREYESEDEVRALIDLAMKLEGLARNAGKHAGGVVIAPSRLTDFLPLYCEENSSQRVAQFDKDDVEAVGLVKFDFLGLRTLTVIDRAVRATKVDINRIPLDDEATYALLKRCSTTAVFQLESRGMKDLIKRLRPDHFEEIIALVALFRPGPLQSGMVDDFIARKHGREKVDYPHPKLEPILKPTYGVILYQEQVMQIAQVLAGYTLGAADLLRRAMGKKKPEEMALQRSIFTEGAVARGVSERQATHIFDLMEKFAGYGFNRSHSAAYAMLSYQTAWLKAHHPAAFMAAVLSTDMDNTDKVVMLIDECAKLDIAVRPPGINESDFGFTVSGPQEIRYGLGAIRGVGQGAVESLVAERTQNGPFTDLADLCRRVDLHRMNKRVLEAMIKSGALDGLGGSRAALMAALPQAVRLAEQHGIAVTTGQEDLFGLGGGAVAAPAALSVSDTAAVEWSEQERLAGEKETLGLYLTGHPIQRYEAELAQFVSGKIAELSEQVGEGGGHNGNNGERWRQGPQKQVTLAGLVVDVKKRNGRVAITLDDRSGRVELPLFDDVAQRYRNLVVRDQLLIVEGKLSFDDFSGGYRINQKQLYDLTQAREEWSRHIEVDWAGPDAGAEFVAALRGALTPFRNGSCPVFINYRGWSAAVPVELGAQWRVRPDDLLLEKLAGIAGPGAVRVVYAGGAVVWH
ncbi:MAG: DNA polymerase III subunit alpha [Xanthomonadaceae bacterium]|nr:DNA polymerase III subunit alpha [Xanthomonadaceae bacterium]